MDEVGSDPQNRGSTPTKPATSRRSANHPSSRCCPLSPRHKKPCPIASPWKPTWHFWDCRVTLRCTPGASRGL